MRDLLIRAKRFARRIAASAVEDGAALGGVGLIIYGVGQIYHPAGIISAGLFLLTGAWLSARKTD